MRVAPEMFEQPDPVNRLTPQDIPNALFAC
jgi:hypothetical protein